MHARKLNLEAAQGVHHRHISSWRGSAIEPKDVHLAELGELEGDAPCQKWRDADAAFREAEPEAEARSQQTALKVIWWSELGIVPRLFGATAEALYRSSSLLSTYFLVTELLMYRS